MHYLAFILVIEKQTCMAYTADGGYKQAPDTDKHQLMMLGPQQ